MQKPDVIYKISSTHKCYKCGKMIKKGNGARRYTYPDKKLYEHMTCPK